MSYWISVSPNPRTDVLMERGKFGDSCTGKHPVTIEIETGMTKLQGLLATTGSEEEARKDPSPKPSGKALISHFPRFLRLSDSQTVSE